MQRKDIKGSLKTLEKQNDVLEKQGFENTFFKMLECHRNNVELISGQVDYMSAATSGREYITAAVKKLDNSIIQLKNSGTISSFDAPTLGGKFNPWWGFHGANLQHYFRFLFQILKFIDLASISDKEKDFYAEIVREQLDLLQKSGGFPKNR